MDKKYIKVAILQTLIAIKWILMLGVGIMMILFTVFSAIDGEWRIVIANGILFIICYIFMYLDYQKVRMMLVSEDDDDE